MPKGERKPISYEGIPIRFRLNTVAEIKYDEMPQKEHLLETSLKIERLPVNGKTGLGYLILSKMNHQIGTKYFDRMLSEIVVLCFLRQYRSKSGELKEKSVYIFWLYPNFIAFAGAQTEIERAKRDLRRRMDKNGIKMSYNTLDFESYYLLSVFEKTHEFRLWIESSQDISDDESTQKRGLEGKLGPFQRGFCSAYSNYSTR